MKNDQPTSVYVVECAGRVKIGVAVDPVKRLKGINTGAPDLATLFGHRQFESRHVAFEIESRLHRLLRGRRAKGEWFDISPHEALALLKKQRPLRLIDPDARHDSVKRFASTEPRDITNILSRPV